MRHKSLVFVVSWIVCAMVTSIFAQGTREWAKRHGDLVVDGETHAVWRYIHTSDSVSPFIVRRLHEDDAAHRLVIRTDFDMNTGDVVITIEFQGAGEVLTFDMAADDIDPVTTISFGGGQASLSYLDWITEMGPDPKIFPPAFKTAGQALIATASTDFQDALRRLALVGCTESLQMYSVAQMYAEVFYNDIKCDDPPREKATVASQLIPQFDPIALPPDAFEQQFGSAYFE